MSRITIKELDNHLTLNSADMRSLSGGKEKKILMKTPEFFPRFGEQYDKSLRHFEMLQPVGPATENRIGVDTGCPLCGPSQPKEPV